MTVGLIGLGSIGRKFLDHLVPFDPTVTIFDPYLDETKLTDVPFADLSDLKTTFDSDIVSVHAARTTETIGMLGSDQLAQIPDSGLVVNTARAEIIAEDALIDDLQSGRLSAVLDVYHKVPLPEDHILRELDNVLLTPHVGGSQIRPPLTEAIIEDIERFHADEPLAHEIPRKQWEK